MKELDLSHLFCEVLGGLIGILLVVCLLDVFGLLSLSIVWQEVKNNASLAGATVLLIGSYLVGLVVDAFGMVFDMYVTDKWDAAKNRKVGAREEFFKHASEHAFRYWQEQWIYFSCYRNLFMLVVPGIIVWSWSAYKYRGCGAAIVCFVFSGIVAGALWLAMRELLGVYYKIQEGYSTPQGNPNP